MLDGNARLKKANPRILPVVGPDGAPAIAHARAPQRVVGGCPRGLVTSLARSSSEPLCGYPRSAVKTAPGNFPSWLMVGGYEGCSPLAASGDARDRRRPQPG